MGPDDFRQWWQAQFNSVPPLGYVLRQQLETRWLRVHSLPEELLTPQTNIHGRPRHKIDYTDSEHPTHESYIKGNPSERTRDMVL